MCSHGNLNGRYNSGVTWFDVSNNEWIAVKTTLMMITKRQECLNNDNNEDTSAAFISSIEISDSIENAHIWIRTALNQTISEARARDVRRKSEGIMVIAQ